MTSTAAPSPPETKRRSFIKYLLGFSVVSTLAGVLTPVVGYLLPPRSSATSQGDRILVATLPELQAAGGMVVPVEGQPIVVTVTEEGGVQAFSAICPHLGCVVQWEADGSYILCPCHDGRFNAQTGDVISGPPPSPLPQENVVVEGDEVFVIL